MLTKQNYLEVASGRLPIEEVEKRKKINLVGFVRMWGFPIISVVFKWPLWLAIILVRLFIKLDYIFTVYPGSESDLRGYCHPWLAKTRFIHSKPNLVGFISKGKKVGPGLVLAIPNIMREFREEKETCLEVIKRLSFLKKISRVKAIALAGQLPSVCFKHKIFLNKPFVWGNKGTTFCITETLSEVMKKRKLEVGHVKIVIVGVGYVGEILFNALKEYGHDVTGVDIEHRKEGVVLSKDGGALLRTADIVIVLTPKGSDFLPYLKSLKRDAIIIDDTHPKIKEEDQPQGMSFYKVAVGIDGVKFFPRIPGYNANWLPGCTVEAIVFSAINDFNGSQTEFNKKAKDLGFFAHLVK